jgi:hypothetical protein
MTPAIGSIAKRSSPGERAIILVCRALPFAALALMTLALAREGFDLPFLDDWRDYAASTTGTYSPSYLFRPSNDTMYPVGKLLDSIFLDAFDGNTLIYQLISMPIVLGAMLVLISKLLRATIEDRVLAACAFVATLLMLQQGSYWGRQYLAYHQAIPLLCLLGVLHVALVSNWRPISRIMAIFGLGLVAGGSYISGAFAGLGMACVFTAVGLIRLHRQDVLRAGLALGTASIVTVTAQAYVIVVVQHGQSHAGAPWGSPLSLDFWLFTLGIIGRSLALPPHYPIASLLAVAALTFAAIAIIARMIWRLSAHHPMDRLTEDRLIVSVSLAIAIAVYLVMVAAGRSTMRTAALNTAVEIFQLGFVRFHFFWITLIWPWLLAALLVTSSERMGRSAARATGAIVALPLAVGITISGAMNYRDGFAASAAIKIAGMHCIQNGLIASEVMVCPELYPNRLNIAYADAAEAGASFVRAAPPTLRRHNPSPRQLLFGPTMFGPQKVAVEQTANATWRGNAVTLATQSDARIKITVGRPKRMARCRLLDVSMRFMGQPGQTARLSYKAPGAAAFSEAVSQPFVGNGVSPTTFTVSSRSGFADTLQLGPIGSAGEVGVADFTVRCLLP